MTLKFSIKWSEQSQKSIQTNDNEFILRLIKNDVKIVYC